MKPTVVLHLALACLATLLLRAADPATTLPIPPADKILANLRPGHPRLLVAPGDFARLRDRCATDATLGKWRDHLHRQAERVLTAAPSEYNIPDGLRLLAVSRQVLDRVYLLAMAANLENEDRYANRAWKELEAAAAFRDWNPRHFLDTAEMTHAFAIGYDWLYDRWTEDQRRVLRRAMIDQGIRIALEGYDGKNTFCWWTASRHNWNQVCNGGIGMGALALADVEPELSAAFLSRALRSLQLPMREFEPDGAWEEGPGYWDYATAYNTVFLAALDSALGSDFQLSTLPGFAETGLFPLCLTGPTGRTFNYADGSDHAIRAPQLFWMAKKFSRPAYARYQRQLASGDPLDLLWYDPALAQPSPQELPLDHHFRRAEVVTMRSRWQDSNAVFVGFKGGNNSANHSNLDLGTFVLDALGERWGIDLGADDYNLPGYFGGQRWNYYRLRAEGHNTLVLNPDAQPDQNPGAKAPVVEFTSAPDLASAKVDLTQAYARHAREVTRRLALLDRAKVEVKDHIRAETPVDAWWFFHTRATANLDAAGRTATLTLNGKALRVRLTQPEAARFTVMAAAPLPASPHPEKQAANDGVRKLAIQLAGVTTTDITVVFEPVQASQQEPRGR